MMKNKKILRNKFIDRVRNTISQTNLCRESNAKCVKSFMEHLKEIANITNYVNIRQSTKQQLLTPKSETSVNSSKTIFDEFIYLMSL